jgi:curved DNA-binding protein CbpA
MGDTFYTILGVGQDADTSEIRRAYRDAVKECHPDVSDDPEATHQFKRLTTARDVLLDSDDRATYDRLGHDSYVSQYVESSVWSSQASDSHDAESDTGDSWGQSVADSQSGRGQPDESANHNASRANETRTDDSGHRAQWTHHQHRSSRADGGYTDEEWQRAPDAYLRRETAASVSPSQLKAVVSAIGRIGPWLFIHLTLIVSALMTSWFLLRYTGSDPTGLIATGLFSVLLFAIVLLVSGLHLVTQLL